MNKEEIMFRVCIKKKVLALLILITLVFALQVYCYQPDKALKEKMAKLKPEERKKLIEIYKGMLVKENRKIENMLKDIDRKIPAEQKGWELFKKIYGDSTTYYSGITGGIGALDGIGLSLVGDTTGSAFTHIGGLCGVVQYIIDVADKNPMAELNLTKNAVNYGIGLMNIKALNVAMFGVFIIDYSLNKLATEAMKSYQEWMYTSFAACMEDKYNAEGRGDWEQIIKIIEKGEAGQPQLMKLLDKCVKDIQFYIYDEADTAIITRSQTFHAKADMQKAVKIKWIEKVFIGEILPIYNKKKKAENLEKIRKAVNARVEEILSKLNERYVELRVYDKTTNKPINDFVFNRNKQKAKNGRVIKYINYWSKEIEINIRREGFQEQIMTVPLEPGINGPYEFYLEGEIVDFIVEVKNAKGKPVEGAKVTFAGTTKETYTDGSNRFEQIQFSLKPRKIKVEAGNYYSVDRQLDLTKLKYNSYYDAFEAKITLHPLTLFPTPIMAEQFFNLFPDGKPAKVAGFPKDYWTYWSSGKGGGHLIIWNSSNTSDQNGKWIDLTQLGITLNNLKFRYSYFKKNGVASPTVQQWVKDFERLIYLKIDLSAYSVMPGEEVIATISAKRVKEPGKSISGTDVVGQGNIILNCDKGTLKYSKISLSPYLPCVSTRWQLSDKEGSTCKITATYKGPFIPLPKKAEEVIYVGAGTSINFQVHPDFITPSESISAKIFVNDSKGKPVKHGSLRLLSPDGGAFSPASFAQIPQGGAASQWSLKALPSDSPPKAYLLEAKYLGTTPTDKRKSSFYASNTAKQSVVVFNPASIYGKVIDGAQDNKPVSDARITVSGRNAKGRKISKSTTSNTNGIFSFPPSQAGDLYVGQDIEIIAAKAQHAEAKLYLYISKNVMKGVVIYLNSGVKPAQLTVNVVEEGTGRPLSGASVSFSANNFTGKRRVIKSGTTGTGGSYTFTPSYEGEIFVGQGALVSAQMGDRDYKATGVTLQSQNNSATLVLRKIEDTDDDGIPDSKDTDDDNDGVPDEEDDFPRDKTRWDKDHNHGDPTFIQFSRQSPQFAIERFRLPLNFEILSPSSPLISDINFYSHPNVEIMGGKEEIKRDIFIPDDFHIWVEDKVPPGTKTLGKWQWNKEVKISGNRSHTSPAKPGLSVHYFIGANQPFKAPQGHNIVQYVYLDEEFPPEAVILQFYLGKGDYEHRVYWGNEDVKLPGRPGTSSLLHMGPLPPVGKWVRLRVPIDMLGIAEKKITGILYGAYSGKAYWDKTTTSRIASFGYTCTWDVISPKTMKPKGNSLAGVKIEFNLASKADITIEIYDEEGKPLRTIEEKNVPPGLSEIIWDGLNSDGEVMPSGNYRYQITASSAGKTAHSSGCFTFKNIIAHINVPYQDSLVRAEIPIIGSAAAQEFKEYWVEYGEGENPAEWKELNHSINEILIKRRDIDSRGKGTMFGNLGTLDTGRQNFKYTYHNCINGPGLNGIYTIRLRVADKKGFIAEDRVNITVGRIIPNVKGGICDSPDGRAIINVPSLALVNGFSVISIHKTDSSDFAFQRNQLLSEVYQFRPSGLKFLLPIELSIQYYKEKHSEKQIAIYSWDASLKRWDYIGGKIDEEKGLITASIKEIPPHTAFFAVLEGDVHKNIRSGFSNYDASLKPVDAAPVISSPTHPSLCQITFESNSGEIFSLGPGFGGNLILDDVNKASGKYSLLIVPDGYGDIVTTIHSTPFDAKEYPIISFYYKMHPQLKASLMVYVNGQMRGIPLSGSLPGSVASSGETYFSSLSGVPVTPDDNWHYLEFNLYEKLRNQNPHAERYIVEKILLGNWRYVGHVELALNTNQPDTHMNIDNFMITKGGGGGEIVQFMWTIPDNKNALDYSYLLDDKPDTIPDDRGEGKVNQVEFEDKTEHNVWYFHLKAKMKEGTWSSTNHYRIKVDTSPPVADNPFPKQDERSKNTIIRLRISDADPDTKERGGGINPDSVKLEVEGEVYTMASGGMSYNTETEELIFEPWRVQPTPPPILNGQIVHVKLLEAEDLAGNKLRETCSWSWIADFSALVSGGLTLKSQKGGQSPAWDQSGTKIVYVDEEKGNYDIYLLDLISGKTERLTNNPEKDSDPAFSPDGENIAFSRASSETDAKIWLIDLESGSQTQLTYGGGIDTHPSWEAEGSKIVFSRKVTTGEADLWTVSLNPGEMQQLTSDPMGEYLEPCWSPDGQYIAYRKNLYTDTIWIMSSDGDAEGHRQLTFEGSEFSPSFSGDSKKVVYDHLEKNSSIWSVNVDGSSKERLMDSGQFSDAQAQWTTDNSAIAFQSTRNGAWNIWINSFLSLDNIKVSPEIASDKAGTKSVQINYSLSGMLKVDLKIIDEKKKVIKSLLAAATKAKGNHKEEWNLRDDRGRRVKDGIYTCLIKVFAASSERSIQKICQIIVDNTPARTFITTDPPEIIEGLEKVVIIIDPDDGWGSGIEKTEYSVDGGKSWKEYRKPFILPIEGTPLLRVRSIDKAGNIEKTLTFEDRVKPPLIRIHWGIVIPVGIILFGLIIGFIAYKVKKPILVCPSCGEVISPADDKCSSCGFALKPKAEAPAKAIRAQLIIIESNKPTTKFLIKRDRISIGRSRSCDIVLSDDQVSAHHCSLEFITGEFIITDLNSTNGTYINEQRIDRKKLNSGDEIQLGNVRIRFDFFSK